MINSPKMRDNAKQAAKKTGGLQQISSFFKPKEKPKETARVGRPKKVALLLSSARPRPP